MPEYPDITVYLECLKPRVLGQPLEKIRLVSVSLLRTVDPPLATAEGKKVVSLGRLGKRVVLGLEDEHFLVFHLRIAGRFRWKKKGAPVPRRLGHVALDFPTGTLILTEAGTRKRATLHLLRGEEALAREDPGGVEVFECEVGEFSQAICARNHTLKRALTDPHILSGIGNAYSDEILHRAGLSPVKLTQSLDDSSVERLFLAVREVLTEWTERLRAEVGDGFPEKVTAFRDGMAVHGRYRKPCPNCDAPVQRIVYAEHETNYCARCQTGGKLLADRALSRLLRKDWPKTLDELEDRRP